MEEKSEATGVGIPNAVAVDDLSSKKPREITKKSTKIDACNAEDRRAKLPSAANTCVATRSKTAQSGSILKPDEWATKGKMSFLKHGERIRARELAKFKEREQMKENEKAEIKELRKSMTFKAAPLPSFYKESAPPKLEFKKVM